MIHFGVGFVPESVVDEGFKVVDKPALRNLIGLKAVLGEDVAGSIFGRGTALVEIGVVVGNLVDDRAEMVALGVVVLLTVGSIGLNDKESIVVVVSESSSLPCEHVVTAVPTIASHDTRLVLDRRHHAHTVEYGHNGVVGSRGLATDVDADNVAVGNTQNLIVGQAPNLEFALAIVAYGNLGVAYGVVRLLARGDDVGKELGLLDFAMTEVVDGVRIEDKVAGIAESLLLVDRSLSGAESMSLELVAEIAIPVDSLETSSLFPHTPKELARFAKTFRAGGAVFVAQQPLGKSPKIFDRLHIVLDDEARNEDEGIGVVVGRIHGKLAAVVEESGSATACRLEDLDVVLNIMYTARDRRDNAFGVVLGSLLPIGNLGIVGTVEVVATDGIEVVE